MSNYCGECGAAIDPVTGKCPNCDKTDDNNEVKDVFCDQCGTKLNAKGKCPNCSKKDKNVKKVVEIENKNIFCDQCGNKLDADGKCLNCENKKKNKVNSNIYCEKCGATLDPISHKCPVCDNKVLNLSKDVLNKTKQSVENLHLDEKVKEGVNNLKLDENIKNITSDKKKLGIIGGIVAAVIIVICIIVGINNNKANDLFDFNNLINEIEEFNDTLKQNSDISNYFSAAESENVQSEKVVLEYLNGKGFNNEIVYDYSINGEKVDLASVANESDELHPAYYTYYVSTNNDTWNVYTVNGEIYANNHKNNITLTEKDYVTIYDNESNEFVELIPNGETPTIIKTDNINSGVLDSLAASDLVNNFNETNEEQTSTEKHIVDMEVWDVQPYYDFDDIDVDFAITYQTASNYATSKYFDFNHDELYDFVIPGGFIFVKDGKYGFGNGDGEIVSEATYTKPILKDSSSMIIINEENTGDGACEVLKSNYYHEKGESGGRGGTGYPSYAYNTETGNVEEIYDSNWSDDAPEYFDLYSYGVKKGMNEGGIAVLSSTSSKGSQYLDGYVVVSSSGTKALDVSTDYNVYAVTSNIIMFTKGSGSSYKSNPISRDSSVYDVMYVDENGGVIASGYESGYPFYEGYAAVKKDGKWGYIDTNGYVVVDFVFDKATPLYEGKAWVIYNGKAGKMNIKDMIDNNAVFNDEQIKTDEWLNDGNKYLQVTVDVLKKRETPSTSGYDDGDRVGNGSIGVYYEKTEADGYTWYKIKDQRWIADKNGEWIKEIN